MSSAKHTPGEWKSEVIGTNSGQWIRIYVDDERYEDGHELFESSTVQTRTLKPGWKDTEDADEIRANVALVKAAPRTLAALKVAEPLLMKLCSVAMNPAIAEYLPFGLLDEVKDWLANSSAQAAIQKAEAVNA